MDEAYAIILSHFGTNLGWEHTSEFIQKSKVEVIPWFPYREGNMKVDKITNNSLLNAITEIILGAHCEDSGAIPYPLLK
jgi:ectoine hydroxylase